MQCSPCLQLYWKDCHTSTVPLREALIISRKCRAPHQLQKMQQSGRKALPPRPRLLSELTQAWKHCLGSLAPPGRVAGTACTSIRTVQSVWNGHKDATKLLRSKARVRHCLCHPWEGRATERIPSTRRKLPKAWAFSCFSMAYPHTKGHKQMEAAAGRPLVRDNSSVLTPMVLGMALIAQLAICRMSSNWEYPLLSSSPITQQRQGRSRQQHGRDGLQGGASSCFQHLHAEAQPHN